MSLILLQSTTTQRVFIFSFLRTLVTKNLKKFKDV